MFDLAGKRVWVAGHRGMVGSALVRRLADEKATTITVNRERVDLRRQSDVETWMAREEPEVVFVAAAKVGGIAANDSQPATFLYDNLMIEANIIEGARKVGVKKLILLGSTCVYPRLAPQPIPEEALLTGPLEPTNQWYAVAKIAGIKLVEAYRRQHGCNFIAAQPTNLYGPGDNFDLASSHVLPALIRRAHEAKIRKMPTMTVWGTGAPLREFLHVDDCADALVFLTKYYSDDSHINIGSSEEVSIRELAELVCSVVGFKGGLVFDETKPDGTPRKLADSRRLLEFGWTPLMPLRHGIGETYAWYLEHVAEAVV